MCIYIYIYMYTEILYTCARNMEIRWVVKSSRFKSSSRPWGFEFLHAYISWETHWVYYELRHNSMYLFGYGIWDPQIVFSFFFVWLKLWELTSVRTHRPTHVRTYARTSEQTDNRNMLSLSYDKLIFKGVRATHIQEAKLRDASRMMTTNRSQRGKRSKTDNTCYHVSLLLLSWLIKNNKLYYYHYVLLCYYYAFQAVPEEGLRSRNTSMKQVCKALSELLNKFPWSWRSKSVPAQHVIRPVMMIWCAPEIHDATKRTVVLKASLHSNIVYCIII